jgi:REP element-mobilizing transposase RayT
MPHSYSSCLVHYVWSTKERRNLISADLQPRLWAYLGGIANQNEMKAFAVGGTDNHVHMLVSLPSTLSIAKAAQLFKGGSSKWIHDTYPTHQNFAWQKGYGAFSIGVAGVQDTVAYIETQAEHHRTRSFEDEFVSFLQRHGLDYDERYVWG